jgi:DNA-binding NarL/FixJ family response regulator
MRHTTVLLVEDHQLVREALRALIQESSFIEVAGQAQDGNQALEMALTSHPDIVIMDIMMPNLNGLEATERISALPDPPKIVILSQYSDQEYVLQAFIAGATGYLLKEAAVEELLTAIETVAAGGTYLSAQLDRVAIEQRLLQREMIRSPVDRLTPREREVLQLVVEGNTNRQVAHKLGISIKTVEKHRFSLMEKLDIRDVTGLVRFAVSHGIILGDRR